MGKDMRWFGTNTKQDGIMTATKRGIMSGSRKRLVICVALDIKCSFIFVIQNESPVTNSPFGAPGSSQHALSRDNTSDGVLRTYSTGNGPNGDGQQSLPSLKASGLLDSWGPSRIPERLQDVPSRKSPLSILHQRPSPGQMDTGGDSSRNAPSATPSGPPVGLQWLANESRQQ